MHIQHYSLKEIIETDNIHYDASKSYFFLLEIRNYEIEGGCQTHEIKHKIKCKNNLVTFEANSYFKSNPNQYIYYVVLMCIVILCS